MLNIEALIFSTEHPITPEEIQFCLREGIDAPITLDDVYNIIEAIKTKYYDEKHFFELAEIANGYQFLTKSTYHDIIAIHIKQKSKKRLSRAALETLSIIAYKQPVTKVDIEQIRGVNCDYAIQKLLEKELITITGRSATPGRPLLYGTSAKFMDYFGLQSLNDLPKIKEFKNEENEIGKKVE
jgi:segregation and condensation protein B